MAAQDQYRDKARTCIATTEWFSDPVERVAMLCIARDYLSLADFAEARNNQPGRFAGNDRHGKSRKSENTRTRWLDRSRA